MLTHQFLNIFLRQIIHFRHSKRTFRVAKIFFEDSKDDPNKTDQAEPEKFAIKPTKETKPEPKSASSKKESNTDTGSIKSKDPSVENKLSESKTTSSSAKNIEQKVPRLSNSKRAASSIGSNEPKVLSDPKTVPSAGGTGPLRELSKEAPPGKVPDVPGLSEACVKVPSGPVGPCAAKDQHYKNPEYFSYHKYTFHEAMVELQQHRCSKAKPKPTKEETKPIPNNKKKK